MVTIIAYHDVVSQVKFRAQIAFCAKRYRFISVQQLSIAYREGSDVLPTNPLLVTFDDAYPSVYDKAFGILQEYGVPATIFAITDLVNTHQPYWWDEVTYYLSDNLDDRNKKRKLWEIKNWPTRERLTYTQSLKEASAKPPLSRKQLDWDNLREMQAAGMTIANHTHTHPLLHVSTPAEIRQELLTARNMLEREGLMGGSYFAYPNGNSTQAAEKILQEEKFKLAFLFDHQLSRSLNAPYRISRLSLDTHSPLVKTKFIMSGLHSRYLNIRKALFH